MKKLEKSLLDEAITQAGLGEEKTQKVIGTLRVSLVRQAAKQPGKKVRLDHNILREIEESIRIGADVTVNEAAKIVDIMKTKVEELNDPEVKFLDDGTFSINEEEGIDFVASE